MYDRFMLEFLDQRYETIILHKHEFIMREFALTMFYCMYHKH